MRKNHIIGKTIHVGSVGLGGSVILAPMSGITDMPFRKIAHKAGATAMVPNGRLSSTLQNLTEPHRLTKVPEAHPHIVQIVGHDPMLMVETAHIAVEKGADIIDINFGCPAKSYEAILWRGLDARYTPCHCHYSSLDTCAKSPRYLKMRLGWDQENRNAPALAQIAEDNGIAMVTVCAHAYAKIFGQSRLGFFKKIRKVLSIPLIVNGDIIDLKSVEKAMACSGAMG